MSKRRKSLFLLNLFVILALVLGGCGGQAATPAAPEAKVEAPQPAAPKEEAPAAPVESAPEKAAVTGEVSLWTQLNTETPASPRDEVFAAMLPDLEKETGLTIKNINQPYDQLDAKLNLAVQASGEVPDVFEVNTNTFGFHYANGNLQDITDYVKSAPWFGELTPGALDNCTGLDGKIYCVPAMLRTNLMYYYPELFPDGYPATTDELLAAAPDLKAKGYFAITGKASEVWGAQFFLFPLLKSFGGSMADDEGNIIWASDATVEMIEFLREIYAKGYAPETLVAAGFDSQIPFMNGVAASFVAGSWSYGFLNPIVAPSGKKFDTGSSSVLDALTDGSLAITAPLAAPGGKPVALSDARAWGIPKGAENIEAAQVYINAAMEPKPNADLAHTFGCVPTINKALDDPRYANSPYWQGVINVLNNYAVPMDPITDNYDQIVMKFADTVVQLVLNPSLDILSELQKAQNQMNNLQ